MDMKNKYGKVAVVMGGTTTEREVSLMSGQAILDSLLKSGIDAFAFDPAVEPLEKLKELKADRAFLIIHGKNGEDGKLQGALEYLNIPYKVKARFYHLIHINVVDRFRSQIPRSVQVSSFLNT